MISDAKACGNFSKTILFFLCISIVLLFLYLPLRFGLPFGAIVPPLLYLFLFITIGLNFLGFGKRYFSTFTDIIVFLFIVYLLLHTILSGRPGELGSLARTMIFPALLYFVVRTTITSLHPIRYIIGSFVVGSLYTSLDFIYQFYYSNLQRLGPVPYVKKYLAFLAMKNFLADRVDSTSYIKLDDLFYFRLSGSLGYNHVTALGISFLIFFGLIFLFYRDSITTFFYKISLFVALLISASTLILSGARTVILTVFIVILYLFRSRISIILIIGLFTGGILAILPILFPTFALLSKFFFNSNQVSRELHFFSNHNAIEFYTTQLLQSPFSLFFGVPSGQEVMSNDLYYIEFTSAYGVIGLGFFLLMITRALQRVSTFTHTRAIRYGLFFLAVMFSILLSTIHSATFKYIQITPLFFISLGVISALESITSQENIDEAS